MQEEKEEKGFPFRDFLQNNSAYGGLCDSFFAKPFNCLFVTALDYCHQMDLHLKQQPSDALGEKQKALFGLNRYILSHVEVPYASAVLAAFDAFKDRHQNDKPACSLLEFQQRLESFLEAVEKQINTPPPPQEQQDPFSFPLFLKDRFPNLVNAIEQDQDLTNEDRDQLSFIELILDRDRISQQNNSLGGLQLQSIDLTNSSLFGPQGIQNPAVFKYMDDLRGAYAVYMGELLSRPSPER